MAGAKGVVKVLGDLEKAKHEKILNDSRDSITILRCASTAGSTGPTNFVMQGNTAKEGYNEKFLLRHGAAPGSTIEMSPSAFMTREAWLGMAKSGPGACVPCPSSATTPTGGP